MSLTSDLDSLKQELSDKYIYVHINFSCIMSKYGPEELQILKAFSIGSNR
jgi:hypothetical protein